MRFPRNAKIFRGQLDAAPFAGAAFLLIILLLMSSRLAFTPGVKIDLPAAGWKLTGTTDSLVVVAIDAAGQFYFQNQLVASETNLIEQLKAALQSHQGPLTLAVQADAASRLEIAARLMSSAQSLGFQQAILLTRGLPDSEAKPVSKTADSP